MSYPQQACTQCRLGAHQQCLHRVGLDCSCACNHDWSRDGATDPDGDPAEFPHLHGLHQHYRVECPLCDWLGQVCKLELACDIMLDEWQVLFTCGGCGRDVELRVATPVAEQVWGAGAPFVLA